MALGREGPNPDLRSGALSVARRAAVALVLAALATAATAHAASGNIKGRIAGQEKLVLDVYVESAKPENHRFTWREPSPTVDAKFRALAANPSRDLCVAALATSPQTHEPIQIRVTGGRATPSTIVVPPGTRLVFENFDPFPHRLYQKEPANASWKPENIAGGSRREWSAPGGSGKFEFRDETTPSLRFWVVVEPQTAEITYPGRDGAFGFTNLAPGDYILRAYFQGKLVSKSMSVSIKDKQTFELKEPLSLGEGGDAK
jgi:hypothetical protein